MTDKQNSRGLASVLNDSISNLADKVYIKAGAGDDITKIFFADNNTVDAGAGNYSILGNTGNDKLYGQDGNDTLSGGAGNAFNHGRIHGHL